MKNGHRKNGHLADGTHPGNERKPRGVDALFTPSLASELEIRTAERDRVLNLLDRLERLVPAGYMAPEDQVTMREVRAALVELGKRAPEERAVWVDRVPR